MNKKIWLLTGLVVVIIALAVGFLFIMMPKNNIPPQNTPIMQEIPPQGNGGIEITQPMANSTISSPLKISGTTKGDGWIGFEGQVGVVRLFDENNNELAMGILTAQGEWMQTVINFETEISFISPGAGKKGSLVFYNENPSGDPEKGKTFMLPITF